MDTLLGRRYRLHAEIARGAVGAVWRGVEAATGTQVAVKLPLDGADLLAEAEILTVLDHPSVVRLRDSDPSAFRGRHRGVTPHSGHLRAWPPCRLICRSRSRLPGHSRASCQPIPAARTTASSRAPRPASCSARRRLTFLAQPT